MNQSSRSGQQSPGDIQVKDLDIETAIDGSRKRFHEGSNKAAAVRSLTDVGRKTASDTGMPPQTDTDVEVKSLTDRMGKGKGKGKERQQLVPAVGGRKVLISRLMMILDGFAGKVSNAISPN